MTLPYQSCVLKRNVWRLRICGPPTQGWVSIFIASFGGDRQHGTGDGGQNAGADGKTRCFMAPLSFIVTSVTHLSQKRRGFQSTAGTGWSGLLGEVEEKGGGTRNQREGLKSSLISPRVPLMVMVILVNKPCMLRWSRGYVYCVACIRHTTGRRCWALGRGAARILGASFTAVTLRHFNWALSSHLANVGYNAMSNVQFRVWYINLFV